MTGRSKSLCHADRPMTAKGLCSCCYQAWSRNKSARNDLLPIMAQWEASKATRTTARLQRRAVEANAVRRGVRTRIASLRSRYGLSLADYDSLLLSQSGRCFVCQTEPKAGRYLDVDHCHSTGKVRGLLCSRCNTVVAIVENERHRIEGAQAYLIAFEIRGIGTDDRPGRAA